MLRKILSIYILLLSFSFVFSQNAGETAKNAVLLTDRSVNMIGKAAEGAVLLTDGSEFVIAETVEKALLLTDRSLYITGEIILFSAQLFHSDGSFQGSDVLYVELVTPAGEQAAGYKYKVHDHHCSGALEIPGIIPSGNYYLRAYTKLMQNFGPESYGYCPLKIVNPEKKEVLSGNGAAGNEAMKGSAAGNGIVENGTAERDGDERVAAEGGAAEGGAAEGGAAENELEAVLVPTDSGDHFQIKLAAGTFSTRESVTARLTTDNFGSRELVTVRLTALLPQGDALLHAVISVVPSYSGSQSELQFPVRKNKPLPEKIYPAETDGITISGTVRMNEKTESSDPVHVNLTLLGTHTNLFYPVLTDKNNRFVFTLPDLYGQHDLFISSENGENASELLVDYDFDGRTLALPSPEFTLTGEEREAALKMASNEKVRRYFSNETATPGSRDAEILNDTVPFYGKPDHMVDLDDFIDLPLLADYFTELPLPLRIRNQKELKSITITGGDAGLSIFPPLLMVDYIPVYDPGELLNINPDKVSRFDIVASTYVRGRRTYGGVLNIITRGNDFAGITLPSSGLFLNYQFLKPGTVNAPAHQAIPGHFPDARNTLYWNPSMKLDNNRTGSFTFSTSHSNGSYMIRVTGVTLNGTTYTSFTRFKVGS
jgi:hypothetical protein